MIFKRKIYGKFLSWKTETVGKTALLIEGARRIGKSTIVEEFARNEYKSYILIDFAIVSDSVKGKCERNCNSVRRTAYKNVPSGFRRILLGYG